MAYSTFDVIQAMERDSGVDTVELRVDGGAAMNDWLLEFQAHLLEVPVRRPALVETTALGAAGLAGLEAGVWTGADQFDEAFGEAAVFRPETRQEEREGLLSGWRRAVRAARAWSSDPEVVGPEAVDEDDLQSERNS
jgi:glycerol kinase